MTQSNNLSIYTNQLIDNQIITNECLYFPRDYNILTEEKKYV
jgi:hypothetical protein